MKVQFESPDREGAQWRPRAAREVRRALRRLHALISRVRVRLEDVNGPAPGVDKRCQVQVELPWGGRTQVDATSRSWQHALETAVSRLRPRVLEQLQRSATLELAAAGGRGAALPEAPRVRSERQRPLLRLAGRARR